MDLYFPSKLFNHVVIFNNFFGEDFEGDGGLRVFLNRFVNETEFSFAEKFSDNEIFDVPAQFFLSKIISNFLRLDLTEEKGFFRSFIRFFLCVKKYSNL